MRPYRRKHHSTWRTRRAKGVVNEISEYLKPFVHCTKAIWKLEPPFPLTAKVFGMTCLATVAGIRLSFPAKPSKFQYFLLYRLFRVGNLFQICITVFTWFLLFLPLCYFFVPPLAALLLLSYFSEKISIDGYLTRMGEFCAQASWPRKVFLPFRFFDRLTIAFFLYDYYQILKCLRSD